MAQPLFGSPRGIGRTQSYDSKAAVLAFVRFGSMLLKKSVFANEQFFPEALVRSSENYVGGHMINPISNQ
ncbi:MAG: hypothetical protein WAK67_21590 [Xanthobacteraceae bacterium]|jgi:hypothetical protein